jgi:hypothetical protein
MRKLTPQKTRLLAISIKLHKLQKKKKRLTNPDLGFIVVLIG